MKRTMLFLCIFLIVALACDISVNLTPTTVVSTPEDTAVLVEPATTTPEIFIALTQAIPFTQVPIATQNFEPSPINSVMAAYGHLTLEIPMSVASGLSGSDIAPITDADAAWYQKTPGHQQITLNGYQGLQGKLNQAQIFIYPATDYAVLSAAAFESMHRLRNIISSVVPVTADNLPAIPFFNSKQLFASNFQSMPFQDGSGIRFLTQYDQFSAPVNNQGLFYQFQGFSADGELYTVAIFPISAPGLSEVSDPASATAIGGVAYPNMSDPNADWNGYYEAAASLLEGTPPDAFSPSLLQLDAMIQSMWIAP